MRILILSRNPQLYSTSRLVLSARALGHQVMVADPLDFQLVISKGRPSMLLGDKPLPPVDLVIPRIGASITNYGLAVVRQFDLLGVAVLNGSEAIARSRDKLRAMQILATRNIDVPVTVCAKTPEAVYQALELVGVPAIVKLQQGAQGIGTMIADSQQAVLSLLETLWAMGQDIILQEYIKESRGSDVRALVVGGKVIASMRRKAKAGEFRSNLHRGGNAARAPLDKRYERAAVAAVRELGLEVAGVDMLESRSGPKVLEVNSSPGLEGIERTTGIDVAGAIIQHGERFLAEREPQGVRRRRVPPPPSSRKLASTRASSSRTASATVRAAAGGSRRK